MTVMEIEWNLKMHFKCNLIEIWFAPTARVTWIHVVSSTIVLEQSCLMHEIETKICTMSKM